MSVTRSSLFVVVVKFNSEPPRGVRNLIIVDNSKVNRGFAAAVNIGIKQALKKGAKAILLLNPDVEISQAQIKALVAAPGDIVSPVLNFSRHGQKILDYGGKVNFLIGRTTHWENAQGPMDYVSGACMLIKREVFEKIGYFDERFFLYFEDADFCLRAKAAGFKAIVVKNVVVKHQIKEQRYTRDKFKIEENLNSNWQFILKWVPGYCKSVAVIYFFVLSVFVRLKGWRSQ